MANIEEYGTVQNPEKLELRFYTYEFKIEMNLPGEEKNPWPVTNYVTQFSIHKHYEEHIYPIFEIEMVLPYKEYKLLTKHPSDVIFVFSMRKFKSGETSETPWRISGAYENIPLKPVDPPVERIIQQPKDSEENMKGMLGNYTVHLFMFKKEHLEINKKLNPQVYNGASAADVAADVMCRNAPKDDSKLYMGKMDDTKKHETVIIPPTNCSDSMKSLQKNYGCYQNGAQVWFDFKSGYMMDRNKAVAGPNPKETVIRGDLEIYPVKDLERTGDDDKEGSWYDEENNYYLLRTKQSIHVSNTAGSQNELQGQNVKFLSNNQNNKGVLNCLHLGKNKGEGEKETIYWNPTSNSMLETEMLATRMRNANPLHLVFKDFDLEAFSINRVYNVKDLDTTQVTDVSGKYKLASEDILFLPNPSANEGKCRSTNVVVMKKVGELEKSEGSEGSTAQKPAK